MKNRHSLNKYERLQSLHKFHDYLVKDPSKSLSWLRLGETYLKEKDYRKAMRCLETAVSLGRKPLEIEMLAIRKSMQDHDYAKLERQLFAIKEMCWQEYRHT